MGSSLPEASWNAVEGVYYTGAGGTWEPVWLFVSIGLCVLALVLGIAHERHAYRRTDAARHD